MDQGTTSQFMASQQQHGMPPISQYQQFQPQQQQQNQQPSQQFQTTSNGNGYGVHTPGSQQQQQQQQPQVTPQIMYTPPIPNIAISHPQTAYVNQLVNQSMTSGISGKTKAVIENMPPLKQSFDEALQASETSNDNFKRDELLKDFEEIKRMTLLDDDEEMYNLLMNSPSMEQNKKFLISFLCMRYKEKYSELFEKYDSLSVYLEFVIQKIVSSNEMQLKNACVSRTVRVPSSGGSTTFTNLFKMRKRGTPASDNLCAIPAKKVQKIPHPFLSTNIYTSKPILFNIGKCTEYVAPSQFATLFIHAQYCEISKLNAGKKDMFEGLRISFSKPVTCLIVTKEVSSFTFASLEHLTPLGVVLENMTGLGKLDDTFAFGTRQNLKFENVLTGECTSKSDQKFDNNYFNIVVVNSMNGYKLSNGTLSCRSYANAVHMISNNSISDEDVEKFIAYNKAREAEFEKLMDDYEAKVQEAEEEYQRALHGNHQQGSESSNKPEEVSGASSAEN